MHLLTREEMAELVKEARISRRLSRELRYVPEEISDGELRDYLAIRTKSGNEGVLLYEGQVVAFELRRRMSNAAGRVEAIICDLCATWQRGTNSASLTFRVSATHSASYLVCADLDCSLHVRGLTPVSTLSRTQLRENISPEERIIRLNDRLRTIIANVTTV